MKTAILAWHFVNDTLRDGRPIPKNGEWLAHEGELVICKRGLHASLCPFDALQYSPGSTLCRVELGGEIIYGDDKVVATERKILQRKDVEYELRRFAADQALAVAHLWKMPDIVREYLTTLDENKKDAAMAAAMAAAWAAAWAVTWDAASAAASAAWGAWGAASDAASAAWGAASDAANAAANAAAWGAANAAANAAASDAARAADRDAAWYAARAAARDAARKQFVSVISESFSHN